MHDFLFFFIGLLIGGGFGTTFMCLFQINRRSGKGDDD